MTGCFNFSTLKLIFFFILIVPIRRTQELRNPKVPGIQTSYSCRLPPPEDLHWIIQRCLHKKRNWWEVADNVIYWVSINLKFNIVTNISLSYSIDSMPNGFQPLTKLWMPPPEDTALRLCPRLILIIIQNTYQMRRLSGRATSILNSNHHQFSRTEILLKSLPMRKQWRSTSTSKTKRICMDPDNLLLIIALGMSWTPPCGIVPAGPPSKTPTLIKIELNTENNSISLNPSTIELLDRAQERSVTRTLPTSQEIWELLASEARILTTRNSRRPEEELRTDSQSTSITSKNETHKHDGELDKLVGRIGTRFIGELNRR